MPATLSATPAFPTPLTDAVTGSLPNAFPFLTGLGPWPDGPGWDESFHGMMSLMTISGDYSWSFTLMLPPESACEFCRAFTGFDFPYESPDLADLVGELVNILAGDVTARMQADGMAAKMGLPMVTRVTEPRMHCLSAVPVTQMWFQSDSGPFGLRMALSRS
jgi:chemotaxis protein CheX